ncbi:YbaB/EbfC family nucleoid-associated protein [Amycolatopsis magusensis]|uniref:YbaB/EbfC family nucleoid-associated protein n=1 Tax=Amycolatopsis magusensis TaxID=882444 RepID=UPI0037A48D6E
MDPARWLADYQSNLERLDATARAVESNLRQVGGRATSPRGEVSVAVGVSGALEDLRLSAAARALGADQLAQLILDTARQAQRVAGAQVVEIMTEYTGEGPALDLIKRNLAAAEPAPAPVPDDDHYFSNPPEISR